MSDIEYSNSWSDAVYLIAPTDDVVGGLDGISNRQAVQLSGRSNYLKEHVDALETGTTPAGQARQLATTRTIRISGDASGQATFNGANDVNISLTQSDSGSGAGSYRQVTVDRKGRVTGGNNPTTLAGYGLTDAAPLHNPYFTGQVILAQGSANTPSLSFAADGAPDTGLYHIADGAFGMSCNGKAVMTLANGALQFNEATGINAIAQDQSAQLSIRASSGGKQREAKLRFYATFGSNNAQIDDGTRLAASIRSGFTENWSSEYLDVYLNHSGNDAQSDSLQTRIGRFNQHGLDLGAKTLTASNVVSTNYDSYRIKTTTSASGYGTFWRNDNSTLWLMITARDDADGSYSDKRPFQVTLATGDVSLVNGTLLICSDGRVLMNNSPDMHDASARVANTYWVKRQNYQTNLGFTPVQQGSGYDQQPNAVKIGWNGSGRLLATVDDSNQGAFVFDRNLTAQVGYFASATPPDGWLKANGAAVSRSTYHNLFAAIGELYGRGDGSSTFNLPDLRGEFVRGVDEGKGIDPNRPLGSWQQYAMQDHSHKEVRSVSAGAELDAFPGRDISSPIFQGPGYNGGPVATANVGAETRPRNIALLACIKY